jgi:GNAT superfamily N-acetyltransferase
LFNYMPYTAIEPGQIGTIVTSLEMTRRPALRALPPSELQLIRWETPAANKYRTLYRRVGEPWLWFSRLQMTDDQLTAIIHDERVMIWAVSDKSGIELGLLELDFRETGQCEIGFFGLVPELNGKGHGRWLMGIALQAAWGYKGIGRVWVHTCTLDAPGALGFYCKSGFTPFRRQVETFPDPRLSGLLSRDAAPQIPLI